MKIRPLQDRVVVRRMEEETTSAGASSCPDQRLRNRPRVKSWRLGRASVWTVEIRSRRRQRGDTVVFGKYSSNTVRWVTKNCLFSTKAKSSA